MIKKLLILIITYFLFFKPEFIFIPHSMNLMLCVLGIIVFGLGANERRKIIAITHFRFSTFLKLVIPLALVALISMIVNGSTDAKYVTNSISILMSVFSSYLLAYLFYKCYGSFRVEKLIQYILVASLIYLLIAMAMFMNGGIDQFFTSLQKINEDANDRTLGIRLHTLGASYFTAGVLLGFILIITSYAIVSSKSSLKTQFFYWFSFMIIAILGMMVARTVLVGAGISLIVFLLHYSHSIKAAFKGVIIVAGALLILLTGASFLEDSYGAELDALSRFGFEMFYNYQETGHFSSESTSGMYEMYKSVPNDLKTWLIGDARWSNSDGSYYKETDIGYLRNIWYFGLVGLVVLVFYYYKSLKITIYNRIICPDIKPLSYLLLFIYILIINFKGSFDLIYYTLPFYFTNDVVRR